MSLCFHYKETINLTLTISGCLTQTQQLSDKSLACTQLPSHHQLRSYGDGAIA